MLAPDCPGYQGHCGGCRLRDPVRKSGEAAALSLHSTLDMARAHLGKPVGVYGAPLDSGVPESSVHP